MTNTLSSIVGSLAAKATEQDLAKGGTIEIPSLEFTTTVPRELEPVLAEIFTIGDLGRSGWFEVVYYADNKWHCYAGSKTFYEGERVVRWRYAKECFE